MSRGQRARLFAHPTYYLDKAELQKDPFKSIGSIIEIFPTEDAMQVVQIIDSINKNATEVVGA